MVKPQEHSVDRYKNLDTCVCVCASEKALSVKKSSKLL